MHQENTERTLTFPLQWCHIVTGPPADTKNNFVYNSNGVTYSHDLLANPKATWSTTVTRLHRFAFGNVYSLDFI